LGNPNYILDRALAD
jgi:hypothetical protein